MKITYVQKAAVILAVLGFGCSAAFAAAVRDVNAPAHRNGAATTQRPARDFLQQLSEKLNLTEEQKTAIKPILAAEANDIKAVHQDTSLSTEQKTAKVKEIREAGREKINALLTPEQQKKFAEMKEQAVQRREAFQNRMTALAAKLNLTEEQKTAIEPIMKAEAGDIKTVEQDKTLSKEQKQAKIISIREESDKKINALLTPEQQAKWAQLKENAKKEHNANKPAVNK